MSQKHGKGGSPELRSSAHADPSTGPRSVRDAIIICDLDERVTYINEQGALLFGFAPGDAVGRSVWEILRMSAESTIQRDAKQFLKTDGEWSGRIPRNGPGDKETVISVVCTMVRDGNDAPLSILIVCRDSRDEAPEQEVIERRRLESLGTLAIGIAHHFNDILGPVLLAIEGAIQQGRKFGVQHVLRSAKKSLQNGAELVSQVIMFATQDAGVRGIVQPDLLLRGLDGMLHKVFPKSTKVTTHCAKIKSSIFTDGSRLYRVLLDAAMQVRRFNMEGVDLYISVSETQADPHWARLMNLGGPGTYVVFRITTSSERKVNQPAFRSMIDRGDYEGFRKIVEEIEDLGGIVRVVKDRESRTECQMIFAAQSITAPESRGGTPKEENAERSPGNGEIILVVDDEPAIRESTRMTLVGSGYKVVTAGDGAEAVSLYAEHSEQIAAVLMDIMMPYMSGDAAIRAILQINPRARIVATSGYTTSEKLASIIDFEHVILIQKPYTGAALLSTLRRVLTGSGRGQASLERNRGLLPTRRTIDAGIRG